MPKAKSAVSRSPAEFFAENRSIAGFDNPRKSTFTTVRELLENSLDAAEEGGVLPEVRIEVEQVPLAEARPSLYGRGAEAEVGGKGDSQYFRVTVRDNGIGMPHAEVPAMLGQVLSGTKYGSKMTTSGELCIHTAQRGSGTITLCRLDIDLHKNMPKVLQHDRLSNDGSRRSMHGTEQLRAFPPRWQGSEISVVFEGKWIKSQIKKYMRQLAVITPYAQFELHCRNRAAASDTPEHVLYRRRTTQMPSVPEEVKHHPSSVNLTKLEELVRLATAKSADMPFKRFLCTSFGHISSKVAGEVIKELGSKFDPDMCIDELDQKMWMHLEKKLKARKWHVHAMWAPVEHADAAHRPAPSGGALRPAGQYNIYLGIQKEFAPDMIATYEESPKVFEGHAFIVEAAVSLGGSSKSLDQGINVVRFANRIPLLFEPGSDVITKTANDIKWLTYKINPKDDRIGVFVSIVSTKIPFKGTGKEFISGDCVEIREAVKNALQKCCTQLKSKIAQRLRVQSQSSRRKELVRYIPNAVSSVMRVVEQAAADRSSGAPPASKRRRLPDAHEVLLADVSGGQISEATLRDKLESHVERYDASEALEFMSSQRAGAVGLPAAELFLVPLPATPPHGGSTLLSAPGISLTVPSGVVRP